MDDKNKSINECLLQIKKTQSAEYVEELYHLICPAIRHIALKYLRDKNTADDFVQDFWADIYKIADKYYFHFNARAYLLKIATNRAINKYNVLKGEKTRITYVDYSEYNIADQTNDMTDMRLSVERAISSLSETEKIVIQSTYFEQKTVREIAAEMNISKSQIDRIKKRALEKMKKYFT